MHIPLFLVRDGLSQLTSCHPGKQIEQTNPSRTRNNAICISRKSAEQYSVSEQGCCRNCHNRPKLQIMMNDEIK